MKKLSRLITLSALLMSGQALALDNAGARITDKHVGQYICLNGTLPDQGNAPVMVVALLAEVAGQRFRIMVNDLVSDQKLGKGGVALGDYVYRLGEIRWVNRDGWVPCSR